MDSTHVGSDGNKEESLSHYSIVKKLKGCGDQSPRAELPQLPSDPLGPITPDSTQEGGDHVDGCCSPVWSSLHRTRYCFNSQLFGDMVYTNEGSRQTPKGFGFDPFAPGPDELMLAPQCKKYFTDSRAKVTRQLNFEETLNFNENVDHLDNVGTVSEDEMLFEMLYNSLLQVITSEQNEDHHSKASTPLSDSDGYKTPTYAPHLSGVSDTCPGAPTKPASRCKRIDKGLCKKLIF
ncbi:hypothetical protein KY290_036701 [Solanum tuberosum]|uniref:Uncharacterized protein n=1 Tax=Solanum tuberosum TaxID=4113 RepID=A0ABQ7TTG2_SOLTU|nr:hypothetical protein KY285_036018 [Solanum tuberosum]KAH0737996.1 hypothetical protein KY290_036701 [Solanum tuberosum]